MDPFQRFMQQHAPGHTAPLFMELDGRVAVIEKVGKTLIRRHPSFEDLMIGTVQNGLKREDWEGFVYVMHWMRGQDYIPLYIGKAERRGRTHPLSANIKNIRGNKNKFGRWGDGRCYHIGDLSHAIFKYQSYKAVDPRYVRWIDCLFDAASSLRLKQPVAVAIIPWFQGDVGPSGKPVSVPLLEQQLITLARVSHSDVMLNDDADPW